MATTFYMPIDPGWIGQTLNLYATQSLTEIDTAAATINELASGDVIATATIDLSTAVDGTVNLTLRAVGTKIPAWTGTTVVSSGEGEGGDVELLAAIKNLLEADRVSVLVAGVYYERILKRGTATKLVPDKKIKQTDGATDLVNPITQRYGGAVEE